MPGERLNFLPYITFCHMENTSYFSIEGTPPLFLIKEEQAALNSYIKRYWLSPLTIGATEITLLDK